jgi:hypothetical protein
MRLRVMARVPLLWVLPSLLGGCAFFWHPRARMCDATTTCEAHAACVAGRCQRDGVAPAVNETRRLLFEATDIAYVRPGEAPTGGALPPTFTLGRESDGDARLLLRFSVPLPREAKVVEAYVLLERSDAVDPDTSPVTLHAERIVDPWDGRSVSWARSPRVEDARSPSTRVPPTGRTMVRVDVRALAQGWRAHDPRDQGVAIVADGRSGTGVAFAFAPTGLAGGAPGDGEGRAAGEARPAWEARGAAPRLELYVR